MYGFSLPQFTQRTDVTTSGAKSCAEVVIRHRRHSELNYFELRCYYHPRYNIFIHIDYPTMECMDLVYLSLPKELNVTTLGAKFCAEVVIRHTRHLESNYFDLRCYCHP